MLKFFEFIHKLQYAIGHRRYEPSIIFVRLGLAKREGLRHIPDEKIPTIIWWTPDTFPHSRKETLTHTIQCSAGPCITTVNRKLVNNSIPQAFMFYGTDFRANDLPLPRFPWQHWALFHEESPKNNWILSHEECIRSVGPLHNSRIRKAAVS